MTKSQTKAREDARISFCYLLWLAKNFLGLDGMKSQAISCAMSHRSHSQSVSIDRVDADVDLPADITVRKSSTFKTLSE